MFSEEQKTLGVLWRNQHYDHVRKLINSGSVRYPPSGSDAYHPGLWKAAHWRWFIYDVLKEKQPKISLKPFVTFIRSFFK